MQVPESTYGAIFMIREFGSLGYDYDLAEIQGLGFTVLATEPTAGQTKLLGYGPVSSVTAVLEDTDRRIRLPSVFCLLPPGEELTLSLVIRWVPKEQVIV